MMSKRHAVLSAIKFGHECLDTLVSSGANVVGVLAKHEKYSANVSDFASFDEITTRHNIPLTKIHKMKTDGKDALQQMKPDVLWVLGWSELLPDDVLEIPQDYTLGSHPTMLPLYRGRAPIPWTILKGLTKSGLTLMYLDKGTDTGDIFAQQEFRVTSEDTATTLYEKMTRASCDLISKYLPAIERNEPPRMKQDEQLFIESWQKRTPEDGKINWHNPAKSIYDLVRATTHPYPGAFTYLEGKPLTIWAAQLTDQHIRTPPGMVTSTQSDGFTVSAGTGSILVNSVQEEGQKKQAASTYANSHKLFGKRLGGE